MAIVSILPKTQGSYLLLRDDRGHSYAIDHGVLWSGPRPASTTRPIAEIIDTETWAPPGSGGAAIAILGIRETIAGVYRAATDDPTAAFDLTAAEYASLWEAARPGSTLM